MKTVAVTGASRGIGREVALKFRKEGWAVHAVARDVAACKSLGGDITAHEADLSDAAATAGVAEALAKANVDVLVNNAGIAMSAPIHKTSDADYARVMAINLTAPFVLCRTLLPKMAERGGGRIVNSGVSTTPGYTTSTLTPSPQRSIAIASENTASAAFDAS